MRRRLDQHAHPAFVRVRRDVWPASTLHHVKAIAKTQPAPGLALIDVQEPELLPGFVRIQIERGSVCGTDLHIYQWDPWSASRIKPPRIIGHEFCGVIADVGAGVSKDRIGQFVASESHIVCGQCPQCLAGNGHVCINTSILGVDVDGGFAPLACLPAENAHPVPESVPREVASMMDALGNAVHTVMAGEVHNKNILITGLGPIGLFAIAICRVLGAKKIVGTEVSDYRKQIAKNLGIDEVIDPTQQDASDALCASVPQGFDAVLEMSGRPSSLSLAIGHATPGGRISLLGIYPKEIESLDLNLAIFKGLELQGIVGRRLPQTWDQMTRLLTENRLDVSPVITHEIGFEEFQHAFQTLESGQAGKIVLKF